MSRVVLILTLAAVASCGRRAAPPEFSSVPDWARHVVWYQIFPERFRNGDPGNDPRIEDMAGASPHDPIEAWSVSDWTGDWYALQPWERGDGRDFYYHSQRRRYGGDLQGILDKLDYLEDLGISAIYLNPIFESPSLHKYDASCYHHVDNNFGPDPVGDLEILAQENPRDPAAWRWTSADSLFLHLLEACHDRGIRVIIDGVFNHVGATFWAFEDVRRFGRASDFGDWFNIDRWDDPATSTDEFEYQGWNGVPELPELREDENGLAPGASAHIRCIVRRWMDPDSDGDPSDGVDGWRLDAAEKVNRNFWRDFRRRAREINPDAYLLAEVTWEQWPDRMFNAQPWLEGDVFDAVMNYRFARAAMNFFIDKRNKTTATQFDGILARHRAEYRSDVNEVLMNLMDSHDTDRLASNVVNPDLKYDARISAKDNPLYDVRRPSPGEIRIQKLIVLFQMTYVGAPAVYYGDEAGMWGGDDPDARKPMLWPELTFADEARHPLGAPRPRDANSFDPELFEYYKKLIGLRNRHPALRTGDFRTLLTDDDRDLYAYQRSTANQTIVICLNNGPDTADVILREMGDAGGWRDLLSQRRYDDGDGLLRFQVPGKSGIVLLKP